MRRKSYLLLILLLAIFVFVGCATTSLKVPVTKPANINLSGISKIAIGDIRGQGAAEFSDELTTRLFQSGRFVVLDRQHLNSILDEHDLQYSNLVDDKTTVELGKLMGSAALVFGRISLYEYKEDYTTSDGKDSKGNYYKYHKRKGKASIAVTLQVTDLKTGSIIAIKTIQKSSEHTEGATNERAAAIDKTPLLASARSKAIDEFMKDIAPYTVYEKVKLLTDDEVPELAQGVEMAKLGQWSGAIEQFMTASESHPQNSKALYNLGVAYELNDEFDKAFECFDRAYKLEANKLYLQEKAACRRRQFDKKKLDEQMKSAVL